MMTTAPTAELCRLIISLVAPVFATIQQNLGDCWAFLTDLGKPEAGPHASHELLAGPWTGCKRLQNGVCMVLCFKHRAVQNQVTHH